MDCLENRCHNCFLVVIPEARGNGSLRRGVTLGNTCNFSVKFDRCNYIRALLSKIACTILCFLKQSLLSDECPNDSVTKHLFVPMHQNFKLATIIILCLKHMLNKCFY